MNIIDAIRDQELLGHILGEDQESWYNWFAALRCLYGLPIPKKRRDVIRQCTGRDPLKMPSEGFSRALFLVGRRSGKSRITALCGAYEAVLAGHEAKLAKGEQGLVAICAPLRRQSAIVVKYLRAIFDTPLLRNEVVRETTEGFELRNGNKIEILTGDFRSVRGFTLIAAIVDEMAFFGVENDLCKSDTELVRAIKPALATTGGKLIAISSPYARKGWTWKTYEENFGNDKGKVLVLNAPSRTLNPTLPQSVIDEALAEDLQGAKSEFLGEFRDDVASFIDRTVVESLVVKGRQELLPDPKYRYAAFADLSGGRKDSAALSIAHLEGRKVVIDCLATWAAPFNPHLAITQMVKVLRRFDLRRVTGDNYAAEFVSRAFESQGVTYRQSEKPKGELYLELLPRLCSGEIELVDNDTLVNQLASLERRTRSGGRDSVDHPPGPNNHDDLANAVAGVADVVATRVIRVGAL